MNKIEKLHQKAIDNTEIYTEADNYLIAKKSAKITKDIAIKFRKWFNDNNYEFVDNTIVGDLYANKGGSDSALTETEIFNIFIETL